MNYASISPVMLSSLTYLNNRLNSACDILVSST